MMAINNTTPLDIVKQQVFVLTEGGRGGGGYLFSHSNNVPHHYVDACSHFKRKYFSETSFISSHPPRLCQ